MAWPGVSEGAGFLPLGYSRGVSDFQFHPELFEDRTRVMEELSAAGYEWLSHYSSVDVIHDRHGLEVCGIHAEDDARAIHTLLRRLYPSWMTGKLGFKDSGADPGFKAKAFRDQRQRNDGWQTT